MAVVYKGGKIINNYLGSAYQSWEYSNQFVDESVNTLRIVVAGKQGDDNYCGGFTREVGIQPPSERPYYPVSPPDGTTPADWDIRHSLYDDVVIIPNPIPGEWHIRSRYVFHGPCLADNLPVAPDAPTAFTSDFMVNMSAETNIQLVGRFLPPIMNNQGAVGDYVPIVATLLSRTGAIPGAIVLAAIERPGGTSDLLLLWDDGLHNDGAAGDGVYGNEYRTAIFGGNYNVRMVALGYDAVYGKWNTREWNGGFFLDGPILNPGSDGDYMPDAWELRCGLDPSINDGGDDKDHDGLLNIWEFVYGTLPCQADTDLGGENDGSEINGGRNPLYAPDDMVRPLGHISVIGFNERIRVEWTHAISYTNMIGWLSPVEGVLGDPVDMGDTGIFTITGRTNDLPVFLVLQGVNGLDLGDFSDPIPVIPRADPDAPRGAVLINNGALMTASKNVTLHLSASDIPLLGLADPNSGGTSSPLALEYNIISGNIQMRISNDPTFADAAWEPFAQQKPWTLLSGGPHSYIVYAQFRDAAGNLSAVVYDTILYAPIFLPIIVR